MLNCTRRNFLRTTAVAGAGIVLINTVRGQESPNERINFAAIGVTGKGSSDTADAANSGNLVAICDVDSSRLKGAKNRYKDAVEFTDFRELFDKMGDQIDAFTCSTPDHMHGPASLYGMRLGKHCFCQKPMTRTIYEARLMSELAAQKKLCTQMGNQGTAGDGLRRCESLAKQGVLGDLKEVHVWCNRPIWPQGKDRPAPADCPATLDWPLWLGVAPERPYANGYHPFAWRGWWDFGTGALGDMACHQFNMPYAACDLKDPVSVVATTSGHNYDSLPSWSIIDFVFPATATRGEVKAYWYDGGKKPDSELMAKVGVNTSSGTIIIGSKAILLAPGDHAGEITLFEPGSFKKMDIPTVEFDRSPGHFQEWVNHIKGGFDSKPGKSNFVTYAGKLTETILLGNLAVYGAPEANVQGELVQWDAANMAITNNPKNKPAMELLVRPKYRGEYKLD